VKNGQRVATARATAEAGGAGAGRFNF